MEVATKKWGNSAAVRIPAAVFKAAGFSLGQTVEVRVENGRVVVEPVVRQQFDIGKLLAGITPENIHYPVDFGKPVGSEELL